MRADNALVTPQRRKWYIAGGIAASILAVVAVIIAVRPAGGTQVDDADARLSYVMPDGWRTSEGVAG